MACLANLLDYLRQLLMKRLLILEARRHRFVAGWHEAPAWINSSRLIFVVDGWVTYTVQGKTIELTAGSGVLVPVNAERSWVVPVERHCDLAWFRYSCHEGDEPALAHGLLNPNAQCTLGCESVDRLIELLQNPNPAKQLVAEAEAKAVLARFIADANTLGNGSDIQVARSRGDLAVNQAVLFINEHYAQADVLRTMAAQLKLSTAHFRKLFKLQMGCSPRDYLIRRRMQVARYKLYHSDKQVKEIAAEVGYPDALYFSRVYAGFWGHPPTRDQHRRWTN